jgi:hypothetical protein
MLPTGDRKWKRIYPFIERQTHVSSYLLDKKMRKEGKKERKVILCGYGRD